jgi:hypothetical protein
VLLDADWADESALIRVIRPVFTATVAVIVPKSST